VNRLAAGALAALVLAIVPLRAIASVEGGVPSVKNVSPSINLIRGSTTVTITGDHFSSDNLPNDCTVSTPQVIFHPLDGTPDVSATPTACSNTSVQVVAPAGMGPAAQVAVVDRSGSSNRNFQVTAAPSLSLTPSAGPVDTTVSVAGFNLHPPNVQPGIPLQLTFNGTTRSYATWGSSVTFAPGNQSGPVSVSYAVCQTSDASCNPVTVSSSPSPGAFTFQAPATSGPGIRSAVGQIVTIAGSNLGGGGDVLFPGGGGPIRGQVRSWSSSKVTAVVPAGAQPGNLGINVRDYDRNPVAGPRLDLSPLIQSVSPDTGAAGTGVTIAGFNFGGGGGAVRLGSTPQAVQQWSDSSVTFAVSPDAEGGGLTLARADGATTSGNFTIAPRIDRLDSDRLRAGEAAVIHGASFGSRRGTVRIGGRPAQIGVWSRNAIVALVPSGLAFGGYPLAVADASGHESNAVTLTVLSGAPAPLFMGTASPSVDAGGQFVKPPKAPGPVDVSLDAEPKSVAAGGEADLTVTVKLEGAPLPGADVSLSMVFAPGPDAKVDRESGTTGPDGVLHAKARTSKRPGSNIVLAATGVYSDQDRIVGTVARHVGAARAGGDMPTAEALAIAAGIVVLGPIALLAIVGVALCLYANPLELGTRIRSLSMWKRIPGLRSRRTAAGFAAVFAAYTLPLPLGITALVSVALLTPDMQVASPSPVVRPGTGPSVGIPLAGSPVPSGAAAEPSGPPR
jgi:hypothetical protein